MAEKFPEDPEKLPDNPEQLPGNPDNTGKRPESAEKCPEGTVWYLLTVIVDHELGSKVLRIARQSGITGGTIMLAHGTVGHRYPKWFDDYEVRKEIVLMIANRPVAEQAVEKLIQTMKLNRPNHGIAFTMSVANLLGSAYCSMAAQTIEEGAAKTMEQAIFVIIDRGEAETVVSAAELAGARGATVINGRGAGVHETSKLFSMEIEPEKEIVLILARRDSVDAITDSIVERAHINEKGKGFLFVVDVQKAYGLFDKG